MMRSVCPIIPLCAVWCLLMTTLEATPDGLVIGGRDAARNEYPWMVQLQVFGEFVCGGSLISEKFILTAKHCVDEGVRAYSVRAILGDHVRSQDEVGQQTKYVKKITLHPDKSMDMALLELTSDATISREVKPIPYSVLKEGLHSRTSVTVAGWGWTRSSDPNSVADILQELTIPVAPRSACKHYNMKYHEFCVGQNKASLMNICHGDSGGPVMFYSSKTKSYVLIGMSKFGQKDCPKDAVYAVIQNLYNQNHNNWIEDVSGIKPYYLSAVTTTTDPPVITTTDPPESRGCFPGDALVTLSSGDKKRMDEVTLGDSVLSMTPEGSLVFSEVIMMMHADHHSLVEYLKIQTEKYSVALRISDKHMVYVQKYGGKGPEFRFAESVQIGDNVYMTDPDELESLSLVKLAVVNVTQFYYTGAFAPLTQEGTIVVDGVVASSYGYVESQSLCHLALWPVRLVHTWAPHLLTGDKSWASGQVHWAPALLQSAVSPFI